MALAYVVADGLLAAAFILIVMVVSATVSWGATYFVATRTENPWLAMLAGCIGFSVIIVGALLCLGL